MTEPKLHVLKTWPRQFQAVVYGRKLFELRRDDRGFRVNDTLVLEEWDPETQKHTGRKLKALVTWIEPTKDWSLPEGFVVMGIRPYETLGVEDVVSRASEQTSAAFDPKPGLWQ